MLLMCSIAGFSRHRESSGIFGVTPVIYPSKTLFCRTAITLSSIKVRWCHRAGAGYAQR